ncbi:MAG: hypothetical protein BYD32DRAFT_247445 [Podila humilis]|nr:MAG: hypothetical protein BYD32DRAFT_247445 [Podila humilis]
MPDRHTSEYLCLRPTSFFPLSRYYASIFLFFFFVSCFCLVNYFLMALPTALLHAYLHAQRRSRCTSTSEVSSATYNVSGIENARKHFIGWSQGKKENHLFFILYSTSFGITSIGYHPYYTLLRTSLSCLQLCISSRGMHEFVHHSPLSRQRN